MRDSLFGREMASQRRTVTFEIHVMQGSRWEIHARYPASQRGNALMEAKALDKSSGVGAVRVVKDRTNQPRRSIPVCK